MMKKILVVFVFLLMFQVSGEAQIRYRIPKVLFITCGADQGRGTVSDGVVVALQAFNRLGIFVRLEDRSALLRPRLLEQYDILIVPSIKSYHDKPQMNSLTYMSSVELRNIAAWVKNGGTLIADVNTGRNTLEGKDRFLKDGILNVNNWELGRCFGVALQEKNTSPFVLKDTGAGIWKRNIMGKKDREIWRPVVVDYAPSVRILGYWYDDKPVYPAITFNSYGKGKALLLPTFYMLHPVGDGGLSTIKEIYDFYAFVIRNIAGDEIPEVHISPWKDGHTSVFCLTFDDGGNMEEYNRVFDFINKNKIPTVFFMTSNVDKDIKNKLEKQELISIQGHSYKHPDFRKLDYYASERQLLMNRMFWNRNFEGFRFPYVSNSFWGMFLLDRLGFVYETSIAADNMDFIRGSVVPYNIPVFKDDFFTTLDLLEISPASRSDWHFYKKVQNPAGYSVEAQKKDAALFKDYLIKYFDKVSSPVNGVMVYLGHPMFCGHSQYTFSPLQEFYDYIKDKNVWIASLNEVARRWNKLKNTETVISGNKDHITIECDAHGENIDKFTLVFNQKPGKIVYTGKYALKEAGGKYYLVFDLKDKAVFEIHF